VSRTKGLLLCLQCRALAIDSSSLLCSGRIATASLAHRVDVAMYEHVRMDGSGPSRRINNALTLTPRCAWSADGQSNTRDERVVVLTAQRRPEGVSAGERRTRNLTLQSAGRKSENQNKEHNTSRCCVDFTVRRQRDCRRPGSLLLGIGPSPTNTHRLF